MLVATCLAAPALGNYGGHYGGHGAPHGGYSGPLASPVVTPNGFLADTPEVAAAKAAHFSEVSKVQSVPGYSAGADDGSYNPSYNAPAPYAAPAPASYAAPAPSYGAPAYASGSRYNGPLAKPVVTPTGFLADTPEVAAAKAAHFSEVSKVQSAPGYTAGGDDGSYSPAVYASAPAAYGGAPASYGNQGYYGAPAAPTGGYRGPLAKPVVTPNGFLADTPEVAAAKAAHFSEVAKNQGSYGYGQGDHGHRYRRSLVVAAPHVIAPVAHVAYAAPVVAYSTLAVHRPAFAYAVHH